MSGFDHIDRNAPVLIRTPKLTRFEPAQYWGGGPPGNSVVLNPLFFFPCFPSYPSPPPPSTPFYHLSSPPPARLPLLPPLLTPLPTYHHPNHLPTYLSPHPLHPTYPHPLRYLPTYPRHLPLSPLSLSTLPNLPIPTHLDDTYLSPHSPPCLPLYPT